MGPPLPLPHFWKLVQFMAKYSNLVFRFFKINCNIQQLQHYFYKNGIQITIKNYWWRDILCNFLNCEEICAARELSDHIKITHHYDISLPMEDVEKINSSQFLLKFNTTFDMLSSKQSHTSNKDRKFWKARIWLLSIPVLLTSQIP